MLDTFCVQGFCATFRPKRVIPPLFTLYNPDKHSMFFCSLTCSMSLGNMKELFFSGRFSLFFPGYIKRFREERTCSLEIRSGVGKVSLAFVVQKAATWLARKDRQWNMCSCALFDVKTWIIFFRVFRAPLRWLNEVTRWCSIMPSNVLFIGWVHIIYGWGFSLSLLVHDDKKNIKVHLEAFVITFPSREFSSTENMEIYADGIMSGNFSDCFLISIRFWGVEVVHGEG